MEFKSAKDDAINIIIDLTIYFNTLYVTSSREPKHILLYLDEIKKRNQHEEILILSKYVAHVLNVSYILIFWL